MRQGRPRCRACVGASAVGVSSASTAGGASASGHRATPFDSAIPIASTAGHLAPPACPPRRSLLPLASVPLRGHTAGAAGTVEASYAAAPCLPTNRFDGALRSAPTSRELASGGQAWPPGSLPGWLRALRHPNGCVRLAGQSGPRKLVIPRHPPLSLHLTPAARLGTQPA